MQKIKSIERGESVYDVYTEPKHAKKMLKLVRQFDSISIEMDELTLSETQYLKQLIDKQKWIVFEINQLWEIKKQPPRL